MNFFFIFLFWIKTKHKEARDIVRLFSVVHKEKSALNEYCDQNLKIKDTHSRISICVNIDCIQFPVQLQKGMNDDLSILGDDNIHSGWSLPVHLS